MNQHIRNILSVLQQAAPDEVIGGLNWYAEARALSVRACKLDPVRSAGIVAALSPQKRWEANLEIAAAFVASGGAASVHVKANCRKAMAILEGSDPLDVLGGFKVRAFYQNIISPHESGPVTIDGHAYCIWLGERHGIGGKSIKVPSSVKGHSAIVADYREAAGISGILPHQLQAITWLAWRRIHPTAVVRAAGRSRKRHDPRNLQLAY